MVQETLPAPVVAEAVSGEVIDPQEQLKHHEQNIKRNFRKMETVVQSVARSLNVIYHNNLWKLHLTADGKRRYTNFNDYLETEFGWDKTAARARQIMKADLPLAIEAGEVPAEVGDKRRERQAPEITAAKAAKVTAKQLTTVQEAWQTRLDNVESGDALAELVAIIAEANVAVDEIVSSLNAFVEAQEAEAETADDSDEDDDDESDDAS
jgi:hypothetical protein